MTVNITSALLVFPKRFKPQTQQGADILANATNGRVLMPDFFEPNKAWDAHNFPPRTDKERRLLQEFFRGPAKPEDAVNALLRVGKALRSDGVKNVGTYGLCWGKYLSVGILCVNKPD